ncbi:conserved hypothetical protein [Ricinus communis]|uniref:Uncharacterized protein n=1 Tax=Ricinus communis TaxID=3988 RepID=B9SKH6_RICCO|nr:conserved hypothetical protein [Ricinus communis]
MPQENTNSITSTTPASEGVSTSCLPPYLHTLTLLAVSPTPNYHLLFYSLASFPLTLLVLNLILPPPTVSASALLLTSAPLPQTVKPTAPDFPVLKFVQCIAYLGTRVYLPWSGVEVF